MQGINSLKPPKTKNRIKVPTPAEIAGAHSMLTALATLRPTSTPKDYPTDQPGSEK